MPNDAKFGLVVGVALVIAVAVVFFRKDGTGRLAVIEAPATLPAASAPSTPPAPQAGRPDASAAPPINQVSRQRVTAPSEHIIRPGDTLFSIAQEHYGDGERFYEIYQANRGVLKTPDAPPAGLTLKIP